MQVSIIIVTYNTRQMTAECINRVFEKTQNVDFEIILVDNGSSDGSKEFFEKDSRIKYVYSEKNLGFGKANNLGYTYASGKYIFLLNSDTLLVNNAIYEMFHFMETADSSVGCCGGMLQNRDGSFQSGYFKHFPSLWFIFQEVLIEVCPLTTLINNPYRTVCDSNQMDRYPVDVSYICGAALFIRKDVVEKCGLFDPKFFMYYEETEMQFRYQKNGFKSVVIDTPKIIHFQGASSSKTDSSKKLKNQLKKFCINLKKLNVKLKSRFIYAKKTFSPLKFSILRLIHLILIPRALFSLNPWKDKKETIRIIFSL